MFSEKIEGWKNIMTGFAIFGFILSFILGLIGGVVLGIILLRALLFAAMFAGISLLIMKIIENFVPEVLEGVDYSEDPENSGSSVIIEEDIGEKSDISGRNLDITIEDGNEGEGFGPMHHDEAATEKSSGGTSGSNKVNAAAKEESFEELESLSESESSAEPESPAEPLEELESAEDSGAGDDNRKEPVPKTEADESGNGELPDIGVYSDSFESDDGGGGSEGLSSIDGSGRSSGGAEILGGRHDTQEIAKAVQTVLKKDQEG